MFELMYIHITANNQSILGSANLKNYLQRLIIIPRSKSPGDVILFDGAKAITLFNGGLTNLADTKPFSLDLGLISVPGPFKIVCGTNVDCIAVGNFG